MSMRIGRLTLAATLIGVGLVLVADNLLGTSFFTYLVRLWPVLLIILGIEWIVGAGRAQGAGNPVRVDSGAIVLLIIVALIAVGLADRPVRWNRTANVKVQQSTGVPVPGTQQTTSDEAVLLETPNIPDLRDLEISGDAGNIRVIAGDTFQVEARVRALGRTKADADSIAHRARLVIEPGPRTQVRLERPTGANWNELELFVTVPRTGVNVAVTTASGNIQVTGVDGPVKVSSASGKIQIDDPAGPVSAQTSSGNISVAARRVGGDYDLNAASGKLSLTLPPDVSAKISARTSSGRVIGPSWLIIGEGRGSGTATLGDGTYQLSFRTSSGNIEIGVR